MTNRNGIMKTKCAVARTEFKETRVIMNQCTLDMTVLLLSPACKRYPRVSMLQFNGTKEEEKVQVLRQLLPKDASNPFKGPLNLDLEQFAPRSGLNEVLFKNLLPLLHNMGIPDDLNTYASILDLLKATFYITVVEPNLDNRRNLTP